MPLLDQLRHHIFYVFVPKILGCVTKVFPEELIGKDNFAKVSIVSASYEESSVTRSPQGLQLIVLDELQDVSLGTDLLKH